MRLRKPTLSLVLLAAIGVWLGAAAARKVDGEELMAVVRTLASPEFEGRRTGTIGGERARAWLADRFRALGLRPLDEQFVMPFAFTRAGADYRGGNVVGLCTGSAAAREVMVVSAHYDHVGISGGVIYHGADDNASGVAVLLAIARHCVREPLQHDAIFVAFDAEELGSQGARAFLDAPPVARERLSLNVNLDMVSRSDARELYAAGTHHWPATKPPLAEVARRAGVRLLFGFDRPAPGRARDDWTHLSDHGRFHDAGIPFVYFGVEDHRDYHQPTDTADRIDPAFFRDAAETILDAVIALDAALPFAQ